MVVKKSSLWDYFKSSDLLKEFASCNICKREVVLHFMIKFHLVLDSQTLRHEVFQNYASDLHVANHIFLVICDLNKQPS